MINILDTVCKCDVGIFRPRTRKNGSAEKDQEDGTAGSSSQVLVLFFLVGPDLGEVATGASKEPQWPTYTSCAGFLLAFHFQHILCHICIFWPHHFLANACFGTASSALSPVGWNIAHIMTGLC